MDLVYFEEKKILYVAASVAAINLSHLVSLVLFHEALFPNSHVHIQKSSMGLDSAKCDEELSGLSGQQKSVRCI